MTMARVHQVAAVHATPSFLDVAEGVARVCGFIAQAGRDGTELLVFPEVFIPGFPYWINLYPPAIQKAMIVRYHDASLEASGPELSTIREACAKARVAIVLGFSERSEGGRTCYNSQVCIDRDGTQVGVHRKLQPTNAERTVWGQGDGSTLTVWQAAIGRISGLICWEHTMNLARQAMVVQHAEIHAASWPSLSTLNGFTELFDVQVEALMKSHSLSAQCFVICAESPVPQRALDIMAENLGPQSFMTAGGGWSAIYHPFCRTMAGPHVGPEERLLTASIDLDDIKLVKVSVCGAGHYARSEVLSLHIDSEPKLPVTFRDAPLHKRSM